MTSFIMIQTWNIAENAKALFKYQRDLRVLFPSIVVVLSTMVAWYALLYGSPTTWDKLVSILVASGGVGVFAYLTYLSIHQTAHEMAIDENQVEFRFPTLPVVRYGWTEPHLRLVVKDNRSLVGRGRWWGVNPMFAITVRIPRRPLVCLSIEAFEALKGAAKEHGLRLDRSGCVILFRK